LKTLAGKGLITFGADAADERLRYVLPTQQTDQYFEKLGQCMEQAQGA
jgi:DNA-binding MarR family transcriptional regulator